MGRKSAKDVLRDVMSARSKKRRWALNGPFLCPKCGDTRSLHAKARTTSNKGIVHMTVTGQATLMTVKTTQVLFRCHNEDCDYIRLTDMSGNMKIVDLYCKVYDEDVTPEQFAGQSKYKAFTDIRKISIPMTEVKMK